MEGQTEGRRQPNPYPPIQSFFVIWISIATGRFLICLMIGRISGRENLADHKELRGKMES
jgi:hypothetical protein